MIISNKATIWSQQAIGLLDGVGASKDTYQVRPQEYWEPSKSLQSTDVDRRKHKEEYSFLGRHLER